MPRFLGRCGRMRFAVPICIILACLGYYYVQTKKGEEISEVHDANRILENLKRIEKQKSKGGDLFDILDVKGNEVNVNARAWQREAQLKHDEQGKARIQPPLQGAKTGQRVLAPGNQNPLSGKIAGIGQKKRKPQSNSKSKVPNGNKPEVNSNKKSKKSQPQAKGPLGGMKPQQNTNNNALNAAQRMANFYARNVKRDPEMACAMPELKPFDNSIRHLLNDPGRLQCSGSMLTNLHGNRFFIDKTVKKGTEYNSCYVSTLERYNDDITTLSNPKKIHLSKQSSKLDYNVKSDFTIVGCQKGPERKIDRINKDDPLMHVDLHAHIIEKPDIIENSAHRLLQKKNKGNLGVNVMLLGIDSTSRMNFMRQMPKSYKALYKLGAVSLSGYNIIGDDTAGALIPLLTGRHEYELMDVRRDTADGQYLDSYNFIWNAYSSYGYVTMFAEDQPKTSAFNLRLNGFNRQPTDHYMRTFWQEMDVQGLCLGPKPVHKVMLDYTKEFMKSYPRHPKFGLTFFTGLTHSDINKIQLMDEDLATFLETSRSEGLLNNTVFILFSDHGARYAQIRATMQGKLEERLPYLSIIMPKWLKNTKPDFHANLMKNHDRLTTPFDIFETLQSILSHSTVLQRTSRQRGISLFNEIPKQRTCKDAALDMHWCTCLQWKPVKLTNITGLAKSLVGSINALTKPHRKECVELSLLRVVKVERLQPSDELMKFLGTKDKDQREPEFHHQHTVDAHSIPLYFQITIEVMPGRGMYEGTLQVLPGLSDTFVAYEMASPIIRVNKYGFTAACIEKTDPNLAKFCFCKEYIGMPVAFMGASEKHDKVVSHSV